MNQPGFDETLAIREVLDDIVGMVNRRERLIESASQEAQETRDERLSVYVKQLDQLMTNFLVLFEPILVKVRAYGEGLKSSLIESESFLRSLVGIIDAGRAVDGSSATLQELEKDADELEYDLKVSTDTLSKIEDLFKRTRRYVSSEPQSPRKQESTIRLAESHSTLQGSQVAERRQYRRQVAVSETRPTLSLPEETRARIEDLFNGPGAVTNASPSSSQSTNPDGEPIHPLSKVQDGGTKRLRPFARTFPRPSSDQPAQSHD